MQRFQLKRDDGDISICHWSAHGKPVLHWAHANGFNAQTYDPLLTPLAGDFDVYAADAEHARHEADKTPHSDERHNICTHFGNGKVNLHFDPVMLKNVPLMICKHG